VYNHNREYNCFRQVDGKKVRLFGLDAPESKQSCQAADGSQYLCGEATITVHAVDL
jgi:endonuclease YncB( thermonuclease family)